MRTGSIAVLLLLALAASVLAWDAAESSDAVSDSEALSAVLQHEIATRLVAVQLLQDANSADEALLDDDDDSDSDSDSDSDDDDVFDLDSFGFPASSSAGPARFGGSSSMSTARGSFANNVLVPLIQSARARPLSGAAVAKAIVDAAMDRDIASVFGGAVAPAPARAQPSMAHVATLGSCWAEGTC